MSIKINNLLSRYTAANASKNANKLFNKENETVGVLSGKFDKLTISGEGTEGCRKSVSGSGKPLTYDTVIQQKRILSGGINYSYNLSKETDKLNKADEEALTEVKTLSWQNKSDNLNQAYKNLRDEIVQGYENGTRQVNVIDESSETGYRTLTMEEELSALDAAYEKNVKGFEEFSAQQEHGKEIIGEWQKQVTAIKSRRPSVSSAVNKEESGSSSEGIKTASDIIREHSPETAEKIDGYIREFRNTKDTSYLKKASNLMLDWLHESYPKHPEWFGGESSSKDTTKAEDKADVKGSGSLPDGRKSFIDIMREHSPETADKMDEFLKNFWNTGIRSNLEKAGNLAINWLKENYSGHPAWFN